MGYGAGWTLTPQSGLTLGTAPKANATTVLGEEDDKSDLGYTDAGC